MEAKYSKLDEIFPLYNLLYRDLKLPAIFYFLYIFYWGLQTLYTALWPMMKFWKVSLDEKEKIAIDVLDYATMSLMQINNTKAVAIRETVFLIMNVLVILFTLFHILYYRAHRNFINSLLFPLKIYDLVSAFGAIPSSFAIGESFLKIYNGNDEVVDRVTIVFAILNVMYEIYHHIIIMQTLSRTVTMSNIPFMCFNSFLNWVILIVQVLSIIATYIFSIFADWSCLVFIILRVISFCYFMSLTLDLGFISQITNPMLFSLLLAAAIIDLFMFVAYFVTKMNHIIPIGLAFALLFANLFVSVFIFRKKEERIIKELSPSPEMLSGGKSAYLETLGLIHNERKAMMYLKVGMTNACPLFYDLSLIDHLLLNTDSADLLATMVQMINFFPGEYRMSNSICNALISKHKLNFSQRFLMFQIYKIRILRQATSSSDSSVKLSELRTMSRQVESMTRGVLENPAIKTDFYEDLAMSVNRADAIWREALNDFPNDCKFCDEYCRYLIEAECNFTESLKIKNRGNMIEAGKNFSVDYSFRSFVKKFPFYLEEGIIDCRGMILKKEVGNTKGSSFVAESKNSGPDFSTNNLDEEFLEQIGKSLFSRHRQRLALHRALEGKLPVLIKCIIPMVIILLITITALLIIAFIIVDSECKHQTKSMSTIDEISKTRFYVAVNDMNIILRMEADTGTFSKYKPSIQELQEKCNSDDNVFDVNKDYLVQSISNLKKSMTSFSELLLAIAQMATDGDDILDFAASLIVNKQMMYVCYNGWPVNEINGTLATTLSMFFMRQAYFVTKVNTSLANLLETIEFCDLASNLIMFYQEIPGIFSDFCDFQIEQANEIQKKIKLVLYIVPVLVGIIAIVPILIGHLLIRKSLKNITSIINSFDQKTKQDAKEMIVFDNDTDNVKFTDSHKTSSKSHCLVFAILVLAYLFLTDCIGMAICASIANKNIIKLTIWDQYATMRMSYAAEVVNTLNFGVAISDNPNRTRITNPFEVAVMTTYQMNEMDNASHLLMTGSNLSKPCIGFDEELDNENIQDGDMDHNNLGTHAIYENASINKLMNIFQDYANTTIGELAIGAPISELPFAQSLHIFSHHLGPKMMKVTQRLRNLAEVEYEWLHQTMLILMAPAFILIVLYSVVIAVYYNMVRDSYKAALILLKRFSPLALVNNKLFSKYFLNNHHQASEMKRSIAGNIIHNACDPIFFTNIHCVIETVNAAATTMLEYTPEQLLGQPLQTFFVQDDSDKINSNLDLMKAGQISPFYEENVTALTDAMQNIPCKLTVLGIKAHNSTEIKSFVVILSDQTELLEQQQEAEKAKAQSEKLLYQILPRDIVVQINRGEKDISFIVPSASIIFIDIVKFSDYSASLTAQEIMHNLSFFFNAIDNICAHYEILTKIKLIGDIYMAAGGLFNPEAPAEKHAEQIVMFGCEVIRELDEINNSLDANLSVRVGINTGGPIIAGVLGKDKPAFDIIGDAINVAARLQSTDEANFVQISQATYDLVSQLNFEIRPRGEVYLKGKGNQKTYLVNPSFKSASTLDLKKLSV